MQENKVRDVRVREAFATLYPELPSGHWATAGGVALRVAARVWRDQGVSAVVAQRLLPDKHFEFRGGVARGSDPEASSDRLGDTPSD